MEKINNISKYPVIFEPAIEGGYNVSFPTFPGCVTFGETFEEAQQMAKEALSLWVKTLKEQKEYSSLIDKQVSPIISQITIEA